jgi:hypothetical protein
MTTTQIRVELDININSKFSLLLLLSFTSQLSFAVDIKIIFTKGSVTKKTENGDLIPLLKGMRVIESDTLITGDHSMAVFMIKGHSTHRLEAGSALAIEQLPYFFEGSKEIESPGIVKLISGTIVSKINKSKSHESFKIKSTSVVFGVRGTEFLVSNEKSKDILLSVNEGEVESYNPKTKFREFVGDKESFFVEQGSNYTKKQKFKFHKSIDWNISSIEPKASYRSLKNKIRKEFLLKRKSWSHDKKRIARRLAVFEAKKKKWKFRTKHLSPSKKLKLRKRKLNQFTKNGTGPNSTRKRDIRQDEAKKRARRQLKEKRRKKLRELQRLRREQQLKK